MADIIDFSEYQKRKRLRKTRSKRSNKAKKKRRCLKPDRQGYLDGLCGVYVIINALKAIHRIKESDRGQIFRRLIKTLEKDQSAGDAVVDGTGKSQIDAMLKEAIRYVEKKYKVHIAVKPLFRRNRGVSVKSYWGSLRHFLESSKRNAVIMGFCGRHDHWTCVKYVSHSSMTLLDSSGYKRLYRRSCRMGKPYTDTYHHLLPTQVWGISLKP